MPRYSVIRAQAFDEGRYTPTRYELQENPMSLLRRTRVVPVATLSELQDIACSRYSLLEAGQHCFDSQTTISEPDWRRFWRSTPRRDLAPRSLGIASPFAGSPGDNRKGLPCLVQGSSKRLAASDTACDIQRTSVCAFSSPISRGSHHSMNFAKVSRLPENLRLLK
jgi:hypothetical protein